MPMINIILDPEAGPKLKPEEVVHSVVDFTVMRIPEGMKSGAASVMMFIKLPDGKTLVQETSAACFIAAAAALKGAEQREADERGKRN